MIQRAVPVMQAQSVGLATGPFDAPIGEARRGVEQSAEPSPRHIGLTTTRIALSVRPRLLPKLRGRSLWPTTNVAAAAAARGRKQDGDLPWR